MRALSKEQKEIQGTYDASKEPQRKQTQDVITKMHSPKDWPDEAREIFLEVVGIIGRAGYLTKGSAIAIRALAFHEYHRRICEEKLMENSEDKKAFEMMVKNTGCIERLCTKLCLNPADVYRAPAKKEDDYSSDLIKLLK